MEVCMNHESMMAFIALLTTPDVVAIYFDSYQIDVGPVTYLWDSLQQMWCGNT